MHWDNLWHNALHHFHKYINTYLHKKLLDKKKKLKFNNLQWAYFFMEILFLEYDTHKENILL